MSNLNYTNYDFDDLVTQLQDRLKARDAWKDIYTSSTGQMLIEFYAYVGNLVMYYVERRAQESYLDTAQLLSSVKNLVKLINYSPKRMTSATGIIRFTLDSAQTKIVYVPKYTLCKTSTGIKYFVGEKTDDGSIIGGGAILPGATYIDLQVIQGEFTTKEITASGAINQVYFIEETDVENDIFIVYVDDLKWTKQDSLISSEPEDKHYTLAQELDNTLTLRFGDNVQGKAPGLGAVIKLEYAKTDGIDGNVYTVGNVSTLTSTIYDEDNDAVTATVSNPDKILGGDAAEDIDEIKNEAPRVFATGDRAVTRNDFIAIIENMAGIANANVWGENEESPPNYDMFNTVRLCILMQNWEYPSSTDEATISAALYDQSLLTVKYEFIDAVILNIVPVIDVIVVAGESLSETQSTIIDAFVAQFTLGDTVKIGTSKKYSNLVRVVDALDSVSYHHLTLEIRQELDEVGSSGDYSDTLDATAVKPESVRVFVEDDDTEIGIDDGEGEFTCTDSDYDFTGTINYTTGVIALDFTSDPVNTVYVRYQQDEDGDIVVSTRQICKLYNSTIDLTSISSEDS